MWTNAHRLDRVTHHEERPRAQLINTEDLQLLDSEPKFVST